MPDLIEAYRRAYLIRAVEEEISRRYHPTGDRGDSPMRCPVHLSVGQECVSVGVAMAVEDHMGGRKGECRAPQSARAINGDGSPSAKPHAWINHRGHAPYLAFGGDLQRMLDELHGRATGCSGGRAGSMHLHDREAGIMGGSPIVGSSVSLATGSAWAAKLEGSQRLTVVFCGDAVPETGQFWESLNFASLHGLRLLYVIEDNKVATATPEEVRSGGLWDTFTYAAGESMGHFRIGTASDSWQDVYMRTRYVLGDLPGILRVSTRRCCAHVGPEIDREMLAAHDPIRWIRDAIWDQSEGIESDDPHITPTSPIEADVHQEIERAFERAAAAPWPTPAFTHHDYSSVEMYRR